MFLKIKTGTVDKIGMVASIACAIHCASLPLVLTLLPLIGVVFLSNQWFEIGMICLSVFMGTWSMLSTYPLHKSFFPTAVLVFGFVLIGCGHSLIDNLESILIPLGSLSIAVAHYVNWKFHRLACVENCCAKASNSKAK